MPRANRHFLPGHVWHITHPCSSEFQSFQSFQSFNRCAPFKTFKAGAPLEGDDRWSEAIAVGSGTFVEKVKSELGVRATHREIVEVDRTYGLREPSEAYGSEFASENEALTLKNTIQWQKNAEIAQT